MHSIVVSNHAIQRWRERVAAYGNENSSPLLDRLDKAIKLQGEPPKGISHYRDDTILFVLSTDDYRTVVVTVVDEAKKETPEIKLEKYSSETDQALFNAIEGIKEKRLWLKEQLKKIGKVKGLPYEADRQRWIESKLRETRQEYEHLQFLDRCAKEADKRQAEKDAEWEKWYLEQKEKEDNLCTLIPNSTN